MGGCCSKEKDSPLKPPPQQQVDGIIYRNSNNHHQVQVAVPPVTHFTSIIAPDAVVVRALYDYEKRNSDELSFRKGDRMILTQDSENQDWWLATHTETNEEGYIPSNYVLKDDGRPESHEAWFDLPRREADKLLLLPGNPQGTFVVRPCSNPLFYALSMRDHVKLKQMWVVKHYKIRTMDNHKGYYINPKITFSRFEDLISHYTHQADGLCCVLAQPCPRVYKPPVAFREMIQPKAAFQLKEKLGAGSFGEVYSGKWNRSVDVAIKLMKPGAMTKEAFLAEARVMHKLHHNNLLPLLAVCVEKEGIYIVTEFMSNGALLDVLRNDEGHTITLDNIVDMAAQVASGMEALEAQNYCHRDLRAANILVGDNYLVKVADFGLAKIVYNNDDQKAENAATKFPIKWTAPEAAETKLFNIKSDVWSFGILLYEMVTMGRLPYPGMDHRTVLNEVRRGYRMSKPDFGPLQCPEDLYQTMLKCWDKDPESRPTFTHLREYFDDFTVSIEDAYREAH
ncbi:tyrosine-protein kinase STK-like [Tubulanus polymorphus]|uniref:tyrosine-protein kinase STK-like n=1 Tax=Tubulanus polymorphus TaxID=672921 RepID=UPI003DA23B8A